MTRTALKLAMDRADGADYAEAMLERAEAAHQVEREAEWPHVVMDADDLARIEASAAAERAQLFHHAELDKALAAVAADTALKRSQALADANTTVARALVRGGFDPASWPPAAALAAENIASLLLGVQTAAHAPAETGFDAKSSAGDIARGAAVGAILGGQS